MLIEEILKGVEVKKKRCSAGADVKAVTDDSRAVPAGSMFIAVKGASSDGNSFIQDALVAGALTIVSERDFSCPGTVSKILVKDGRRALARIAANFYKGPSEKLKTIGITGTNGKTTITYLLESIIASAGGKAGVVGTINYRIGSKVTPSKNTTPGVLQLQGMLADMVKEEIGYAVMEVSSHSLDQGRVDGVYFDAAVCANVTSDHLDYHKTRENYLNAKKKIFSHLKEGGVAVLNNDDKASASMKGCGRGKAATYGVKNDADVRAVGVKVSISGSEFTARTLSGGLDIRSRLIGIHNVSNMLASIAVAIHLGIGKEDIAKGIARLRSVPGRLESVELGQPFKVFVDYAHTEDALRNVLGLLKEAASGRIITVFGCGGDRDRTKRPLMGRAACELSDRVVITSDNPRFEEPEAIIDEIEAGIRGAYSNYETVIDRYQAIKKALRMAGKGDIVLIAGKGHEDYQIIKDKTIHFDDREAVRELWRVESEGKGDT